MKYKNWPLLITGIIFLFLLLRNPYSNRTLIPNLEPFPDAFYYTTPPRCFLAGYGWNMCRMNNPEIEGIAPVVPPAYSATFIPGYLINSDVRTFYFTNVLLAFISLILLYKISQQLFKNQIITFTILFLYVTNYFVYWYPTLAMAENLLNPIFLLSILVLLQQSSPKKMSLLVGCISLAFYATKFAFAPLTILFPFVYAIKILTNEKETKDKISHIVLIALPAGVGILNLVGFSDIYNILNQLFNGALDSNSTESTTSGSGFFSLSYLPEHILKYSHALVGKSQRFLWDNTPLTERWIALPALFGIIVGLKNNTYVFAKVWIIISIIAQLIFMSTFYVVDIRYVYHFLPILLLGFGFFLQHLQRTILKNELNFYTFVFVLLSIYCIGNVIRLKSTIMVNLKYAETPWWYLSQIEMNTFFDTVKNNETKPILITISSPFLTDNYSHNNYTTLPLNEQQDFSGSMHKIWGETYKTNLIDLYTEKVLDTDSVYVTNYGTSGGAHFRESFSNIEKNFDLDLVHSGCYNLCNIYKLEIKDEKISQ